MPNPSSTSRRLRLASRIGLSLAALLASLLAAELAMRLRQYWRYGAFGPIHDFVLDEQAGIFVPEAGRRTRTISINSQGFRGPEIESPKPRSRVRVAFLGASTTFCAEVSSNDATWPAQLIANLQAALPRADIDYVNAAAGGYTLAQMHTALTKRVAPLQPDVIVIYEAANELAKNSRRLAAAQGLEHAAPEESSWLDQHSILWSHLTKNLRIRRLEAHAAETASLLIFDDETLTRQYRAGLTGLIEDAKRHAPHVAVVTFAQRTRSSLPVEERLAASRSSLYYMPYMTPDTLIAGYHALNVAAREVASETGVLLIEAEECVPADPRHFNDSVHLTDAGAKRLAECVAQGLLADPGLRARLSP